MSENGRDKEHGKQSQRPRDGPNEWPVIHRYTRAQAIEDGVLVDLTAWAKETGFRIPVACTAAVWNGYIVPPEGTRELGQSERGRTHDLLWMLFCAIKAKGSGDRVQFQTLFLQSADRPGQLTTAKFNAECGPCDKAEPVITILMPGED